MSRKTFFWNKFTSQLPLFLFCTIIKESFCLYNWDSFQGCNYAKNCTYETEQEMLIAYAKGLPNIESKNFDEDFLICQEMLFLCGHVVRLSNKQVSESSGVRIGIGVDLSRMTLEDLSALKINQNAISRLTPYLGLHGDSAALLLKNNKNLTLDFNETMDLSKKVHQFYLNKLSSLYNNLKKEGNAEANFTNLHLSIKTALFSLYLNRPKFDYTGFNEALAANNWTETANIIESLKGSKIRRKAEALLLRSLKIKCQNNMYLSVLMDESGSINDRDFVKEMSFVSDLIKKNPDNDQVFISLITFSTYSILYSNFTNNMTALQETLNFVSKKSGSTNTGDAINSARRLFLNTESYKNNILDARIILIITDGQSNFRNYTVSEAEITRKSGIQIISVGVGGNINLDELYEMSGGNQNVMLISDFSGLSMYLETLRAGVCTQSAVIDSNITFSASLKNMDSPIYLMVEKRKSSNQRIIVNDSLTSDEVIDSKIVICASYNDPYPDKVSNELCHLGRNKGLKELVLENKEKVLEKNKEFDDFEADLNLRNLRYLEIKEEVNSRNLQLTNNTSKNFVANSFNMTNEEKEILYFSVQGLNVNFTIKTEECDPKDCRYGTNDLVPDFPNVTNVPNIPNVPIVPNVPDVPEVRDTNVFVIILYIFFFSFLLRKIISCC